jgi:hypothetical protein
VTQIDVTASTGNNGFEADTSGVATGVTGSNTDSGGGFGNRVYGIAQSGTGILGGSSSGTGVYGSSSSGSGVYGASSSGTGVYGASSSGSSAGVHGTGVGFAGVYGQSTNYWAVYGQSTNGSGVLGTGGMYGGEFAGNLANIRLDPNAGLPGAPTGSQHYMGEIYVDTLAVPYICEADGIPGSWQAVGNFRPFLAGHRVFNSSMSPGGLASGISATTDVHGLDTGVPDDAIAVYCAVQSYKSGTLTIFPDGASEPTAANWSGVGTTGILNLLYMLVPLSTVDGKFSIRSHLTATGQVYVDVWGYLL